MKTLTLKREALAVLGETDLAVVRGGVATQYCVTKLGLCDEETRLPTMRCTPPPAP